jgi:hypothetical protein
MHPKPTQPTVKRGTAVGKQAKRRGLLPVAARRRVQDVDLGGLEASCLVKLTRPPVIRGSRSAFPLQSESPCLSGGLVSPCTIARGSGGVNGSATRPVDDAGDKSGRVVDGRMDGCGQPGGRLGTTAGLKNSFASIDLP